LEQESELCGHATLASAFVLFHRYSPDATVIHFETQTKGTLSAARVPSPTGFGVALSLPLGPTTASLGSSNDIADIVAKATGIDVSDILEVGTYGEGSHSSAVVEVKSSVPLKDLKVDTSILVPTLAYQTVVTQSAGGDKINSRVFIPGVGIPEDPVVSL
jgi:predicted PhzF superfamily epimerase YddE/YHI9